MHEFALKALIPYSFMVVLKAAASCRVTKGGYRDRVLSVRLVTVAIVIRYDPMETVEFLCFFWCDPQFDGFELCDFSKERVESAIFGRIPFKNDLDAIAMR